MEKRFVSFLLASLCVVVGYSLLMQALAPPVVQRAPQEQQAPLQGADAIAAEGPKGPKGPKGLEEALERPSTAGDPDAQMIPPGQIGRRAVPGEIPEQWFTLGSADPASPYRMLVTLTNRGAAIVDATLNSPHYLDLDLTRVYLGYLALTNDTEGNGCRVGVVGEGTPAATAVAKIEGVAPGLRGPRYVRTDEGRIELQSPGDLITAIDGREVAGVDDFQRQLEEKRPGQEIELTLRRKTAEQELTLRFAVTLTRHPLAVLEPELPSSSIPPMRPYPASFLFTLSQIGQQSTPVGRDEIPGLPSLRESNWDATMIEGAEGPGIEFRYVLAGDDLAQIGQEGELELIKRYRLARVPPQHHDQLDYKAYHLTLELEIRNHGPAKRQVAYQLDGPTGLTPEGWWYSFKVHPTSWFGNSPGARDVAWQVDGGGPKLFTCREIVSNWVEASEGTKDADTDLFIPPQSAPMKYLGCDAQYFAAVLLPPEQLGRDRELAAEYLFASAAARPVAQLDSLEKFRRTDVSFRLTSQTKTIPPGGAFRQDFRIFVGPKHTQVLAQYGLQDLIVYGLFGSVSWFLLQILHFFYNYLVGNYGLAIIMLTVLVRGCMFPMGRKIALNAQKMQELAPEMKKIADKHKNDMEKRTQAQRELFRKHNYNPFGGCLLMFIQLPIFIGLYRGLSFDIELRQAPLIPGIAWCSNLAGPDQLVNWGNLLPQILSGYTGWLGPYFNVLPVVTCILFMVHQKLFTPPATDEQQRVQQQVMKFMMLFMAVLFFKVASGLCLYFIASSLWGVAERLLLPKTAKTPSGPPATSAMADSSGGNGAAKSGPKGSRKGQKRR